jgi:hypothetical protein
VTGGDERPPPLPEPPDHAAPFRPDCPNHPGVKVRFRCVECRFGGCGDCAQPRQNRTTQALSYWCLQCGNRALEVAPAPFTGKRFHEELPRVLGYPVRLAVFPSFMMFALISFGADLLATPLYTFLPRLYLPASGGDIGTLLSFWVVAFVGPLVWSLCLHCMLGFIESAAGGAAGALNFTDIDLMDVAARKRMVAAGTLFSLASLPVVLLLAGRGDPSLRPLVLLYALAQCLIPMGLAMIAVAHQPGAAFSIPALLLSIGRVRRDYLILLACSLPLFLPELCIAFMQPERLTEYWLWASPLRAYFRMVQLHLMGRIAHERKDVLTWAA